MPGKIVEVSCNSGHLDTLKAVAQASNEIGSVRILASNRAAETIDGEVIEQDSIRLFVEQEHLQTVLDRIQSLLPVESGAVVLLTSVDATIRASSDVNYKHSEQGYATREELFNEVSKGTELDRTFVLLTIMATLVVTIGIAEDNVAVVIGAMLIAPLLGPNLGLALGAALGDKDLIKTAIGTNAVGLTITIGLAALLSQVWPPNLASNELISRTLPNPAAVILALASGVAATVSLTTRLENTLVGVMVSVALVPPAAVLGMMIGTQNWAYAGSAGLLLAINVIAVNLSAQLVFALRGVKPRTWLAKREAKESSWINISIWIVSLLVCFIALAQFAN